MLLGSCKPLLLLLLLLPYPKSLSFFFIHRSLRSFFVNTPVLARRWNKWLLELRFLPLPTKRLMDCGWFAFMSHAPLSPVALLGHGHALVATQQATIKS